MGGSNSASWYMAKVKRAIKDYDMIPPGSHVVAGISGGKDSTVLLWILAELQKRSHLRFTLEAVHLDLGWGPVDTEPLRRLCADLGVPLHIRAYPVAKIISLKPGFNPCALCGKLRHGVLNRMALDLGAQCVALGHHLDDVIETFFLNLIFAGQIKTFMPKTYLSRTGLGLIRPLVYLPEKTVVAVGRRQNLPVLENPCPYNGHTKREEMREITEWLAARYPDFREMFLRSLHNVRLENLWRQDR